MVIGTTIYSKLFESINKTNLSISIVDKKKLFYFNKLELHPEMFLLEICFTNSNNLGFPYIKWFYIWVDKLSNNIYLCLCTVILLLV